MTFETNADIYLLQITYSVNDILFILVILRIYILFRFFISSSDFYNQRADRVM